MKQSIWILFLCVAPVMSDSYGQTTRDISPASKQLKDSFTEDNYNDLLRFFTTSCAECHGETKTRGGVDRITDLKHLKTNGLVVPGDLEESIIWDQIQSGAMPPDYEAGVSPPSKKEIELLKKWIESGAPDLDEIILRQPISFEETLRIVRRDITSVAPKERMFMRYLSLVNFYNHKVNGQFVFNDAQLASFRDLVGLMANSLSWNSELIDLRVVPESGGALLRLDLRETTTNTVKLPNVKGLGISDWSKIAEENPYRIFFKNSDAETIRKSTKEKFPIVRADFFVFTSLTGQTYYDILGLKGGSSELEEKLLGSSTVDILKDFKNIDPGKIIRSGFSLSGVSASNRLIERHNITAYDGAYWLSYDFEGNSDRKNLLANPSGPSEIFANDQQDDVFKHDGGEVIFNLPNGLQAYLLIKHDSSFITEGPFNIVANTRAKRPEEAIIRNAISCTLCHAKGMIRKPDEVLDAFLANEENFSETTKEFIRKFHPATEYKNNPLDQVFDDDSARYLKSVNQIAKKMRQEEKRVLDLPVALTKDPKIKSLWDLYDSFRGEVSFEAALTEVDLNAEEFVLALKDSNEVRLELSNFLLASPKPIHRDTFKDIFLKVTGTTKAAERGYVDPKTVPGSSYLCSALVSAESYSNTIFGDPKKRKKDAESSALRKCEDFISDKRDLGFSCKLNECNLDKKKN